MSAALISVIASVGVPLVEAILARRIGAENASLARNIVEDIARRAGLTSDDVERAPELHADEIRAVVADVEAAAPELISLYHAELASKDAIFSQEAGEPLWVKAWRPLGMYGLGFLWFWNLVILHVANAIWKIALPQTDLATLLQLSALYMSLYMGGHTVKAVMRREGV